MRRFSIYTACAGQKVVLAGSSDTTIYTIKEIHNYNLHLVTYECGQEIDGGWVDVFLCFHPTDEQLNAQLVKA